MYFFANWKLQKSFLQSQQFVQEYGHDVKQLAQEYQARAAFFVSAEQLFMMRQSLDPVIAIGAQNCSDQLSGKYTGEISAHSLHEVGVSYCLVGHTERRTLYHESITDTLAKVQNLVAACVVPVVCCGQTLQEQQDGKTMQVLQEQLQPILEFLSGCQHEWHEFFICYEPIYAVGSGVVPAYEELRLVYDFLQELISLYRFEKKIVLLYGGSVTGSMVEMLKRLPVEGFLIGNASLDFKDFKSVVVSATNEVNITK